MIGLNLLLFQHLSYVLDSLGFQTSMGCLTMQSLFSPHWPRSVCSIEVRLATPMQRGPWLTPCFCSPVTEDVRYKRAEFSDVRRSTTTAQPHFDYDMTISGLNPFYSFRRWWLECLKSAGRQRLGCLSERRILYPNTAMKSNG